jgi:hypothetical protein
MESEENSLHSFIVNARLPHLNPSGAIGPCMARFWRRATTQPEMTVDGALLFYVFNEVTSRIPNRSSRIRPDVGA